MLIWHPFCMGSLNGVLRKEVKIDMWEFVINRAEHGFTSTLDKSPLRAVIQLQSKTERTMQCLYMQKVSGVILSPIEYKKGLSSKEHREYLPR